MKKWKIEIIQCLNEVIEAETEDEAIDIAWKMFEMSGVECFVEEEEEEED